jgi:8-hydroxy-5-deazaflavin:NADPH oxidoreductase
MGLARPDRKGFIMQKFGVLGSGVVAQTLAKGLVKHGYGALLGTRDPAKLAAFTAETGIAAGSFAEAAAFGDTLILAVSGPAAVSALELAGAAHIAGKAVFDATNPIAAEPPENGVLRFFTGPNDSLMERLQTAFPAARFVKVFSCVGNGFMVNPQLPGGPPTMFIAGNDAAAKADATKLLSDFGWETWDMGTATSARAIEPLCQLWCLPGFRDNHWTHAFKVLKL